MEIKNIEIKDIIHQAQAAGKQLALFADIYQESERQTEAAADPLQYADNHGIYRPMFAQSLHDKATTYHNNNRAAVEKLLKGAGFTDQEAARILTDYHAAAYGLTLYTATPETMAKALNNLSPRKCYLTDKHLFYKMVFRGYAYRLQELRHYQEALATTDPGKKLFYKMMIPPLPTADAVSWGIIYGLINPAAFCADDVAVEVDYLPCEVDPVQFVRFARLSGDWVRYFEFFRFAEKALLATPVELSNITKPTQPKHGAARAIIESVGGGYMEDAERWDEMDADQLGEVDERPNVTYLSRPLANIGAGGVLGFQLENAPRPGDNILKLLRERKERGEGSPKTYETCERVINGVNLMYNAKLFSFNSKDKIFTTYTTYTELARFCGYDPGEMNADQKRELQRAAMFLYGVQFIKDGRKYSPIVFLERKGNDGAQLLQIILPTEYVGIGKDDKNLLLVSPRQVEALRLAGKGAQQRFYNMILSRGNKLEDDILAMIYNYDAEIMEAQETGGPAAVKKKKNNWSRNKSKKRQQLAQWFEEAKQKGVIKSYKKTTGKNGVSWSWDNHF